MRDRAFLVLALAVFAAVILVGAPRQASARPAPGDAGDPHERVTGNLVLAGIEGESASAEVPRSTEVLSWSWGVSNPTSSSSGVGRATLPVLTFTHAVDKSTPQLFSKLHLGQVIASGRLILFKPDLNGGRPHAYMRYCFTSGVVRSSQTYDDGVVGDGPLEEVTMAGFRTLIETYVQTPQSTPVSRGWDYARNVALSGDCRP
jgi:type VI secretion system secreted protein Hcp